MSYVRFLQDLRSKDLSLVGGKGANLGELIHAKMRVPAGFVLTTAGYRRCVPVISLQELDIVNLRSLEQKTLDIQKHIAAVSIPASVELEIKEAYRSMGSPIVAVRSSATAEDLPSASFAGQQETYLNVQGEEFVLEAVKKCWASLWSLRAVQYRTWQGVASGDLALAVVIQGMAPHEISGVVFTLNPLSNEASELIINAAPGLGEALVQGEIVPDQWIARRPDGAVLKFTPAPRIRQSAPGLLITQRPSRGCLNSQQVKELAQLCLRIEEHFESIPQDIEWSYGLGEFHLLQSRPITTLGKG
ncbi:MAG TPA: PEP/pyruvate-binding domain-containing protein [Desulfosporosinus sp.]|nr:PEP/pyruvate-binding domain-containing protein [Desulfosporosinus sp.]